MREPEAFAAFLPLPCAASNPDETLSRRTSRMHLNATPDASSAWRVVAQQADGGEALNAAKGERPRRAMRGSRLV
jgi:hypothetical protein